MKKLLLFVMVCMAFTMQAQKLDYKGVFVMNVEQKEDLVHQSKSYNIYMSNDRFVFDAKPIANVPVQDRHFTYELELDRMVALRFRGVDEDGKEDGSSFERYAVPGETMELIFMHGHNDDMVAHRKHYPLYHAKVNRYKAAAIRRFNGHSPNIPEIKGIKWQPTKHEDLNGGFRTMHVFLGKDETLVHFLSHDTQKLHEGINPPYLEDDKGNRYRLLRNISGNILGGNDSEEEIFGGYAAFEAMPQDVKSFNLMCYSVKQRNIQVLPPARKHKPNFFLTVTASPDIADKGYLIHLCEKLGGSMEDIVADLDCDQNRQVRFSTYLAEPTQLVVIGIFADGSLAQGVVSLPAFPDTKLQVTVRNGRYDFSGTGFYEESDSTESYVNATKHGRSEEEYKPLLTQYLVEHANEQGTLYYYYHWNVLSNKEIKSLLNDEQLASPFGKIIAKEVEREEWIEKNGYRIVDHFDYIRIPDRQEEDYQPDLDKYRQDMLVGKPVDLGLSVKWADMNVGAESAERSGLYFTWADAEPLDSKLAVGRAWYNYKWGKGDKLSLRKYNTLSNIGSVDSLTTILPQDDAATMLWQAGWRMPTYEEMTELREKCKWEWTKLRGHEGYKVTGPNGKHIFLPAAGCHNHNGEYGFNTMGYYWTSTVSSDSSKDAHQLSFSQKNINPKALSERFAGRTIRAVCK